MKRLGYLASAVVTAAMFAAAPASAVTFDAFTGFTGNTDQSNAGINNGYFIYGELEETTPGTPGTFFDANSACFIAGSICLQDEPNGDVPGVTKGGSPAFQYGSVNVPQDRLLIHPDNQSPTDLTAALFVAPTAGLYSLTASFNFQDINPTGVDLRLIQTTGGSTPFIFTALPSLTPGGLTSYTFNGVFNLGASQAIGFGIGNGGDFSNDSIGFNFSATAVPEPASWALMIGGFGIAGGALRRQRARQVVRFA